MPKKTRKEKLHIDRRFELKRSTSAFTFTASSNPVIDIPVSTTNPLLVKDIKKTLLLGTLFIILECVLYLIAPKLNW